MTGASSPEVWRDRTPLLVLGTGAALPGEAASRFWRRLADDMGKYSECRKI